MSIIEYDLENEKVKYLIETDEKLGKLIKYIKQANIIIEEDGFKCIVKYIIGQQISDKARETIWQRIRKEIVPLTPEKVLTVSITDFRNYGLSERKIIYIKSLESSPFATVGAIGLPKNARTSTSYKFTFKNAK